MNKDACLPAEGMSYFQIKRQDGNVLDLPTLSSSLTFTSNELNDSQFWYLYRLPNSDYGYISSKKNAMNEVLSISLHENFEDNGKNQPLFCFKPVT